MPIEKDLGLYIHIPFCKTICVYCAFSTFANKNTQIKAYITALISEISAKSELYKDRQVRTIYLGGGTPSILDSEDLAQILETIHRTMDTKALQSIELEANPESLTPEKIHAYQKLGVTRISVGIQTLNNKSLWKIARPHDDNLALTALENLNQAGFENFGCDLIIGLPYQTIASFQNELAQLLSFRPTHLSTYFLSMDTPKIQTFIEHSPSEDDQVTMYEWADQYLTQAGFFHYEVSNFAKPGFESIHNKRYWDRMEYLGLGLSAHSFLDEKVSENTTDFRAYLAKPTAVTDTLHLTNGLALGDFIMLTLRRAQGIDLESLRRHYGAPASRGILKKAAPFIGTNHLILTPTHLRPTLKGWLILNFITRKLTNNI